VAATYFADTAFWIGLSNRRDEHHRRAALWSRYLSTAGAVVCTTEAVLWEWLNGMSHPTTRSVVAAGYRRCHRDDAINVIPFSDELRLAAMELFESRIDKAWSLTDCMSFVVMKERGISEVLGTDHHFEQAGFRIVLPGDPPVSTIR